MIIIKVIIINCSLKILVSKCLIVWHSELSVLYYDSQILSQLRYDTIGVSHPHSSAQAKLSRSERTDEGNDGNSKGPITREKRAFVQPVNDACRASPTTATSTPSCCICLKWDHDLSESKK